MIIAACSPTVSVRDLVARRRDRGVLGAAPERQPAAGAAVRGRRRQCGRGRAATCRGCSARRRVAPSLAQATPEAPSRFKLVGVMAPRSSTAQAEAGARPGADRRRRQAGQALRRRRKPRQRPGAASRSGCAPRRSARRRARAASCSSCRRCRAPNSGVLPPPGGAACRRCRRRSRRRRRARSRVDANAGGHPGVAGGASCSGGMPPAPLPGQGGPTRPAPGGAAPPSACRKRRSRSLPHVEPGLRCAAGAELADTGRPAVRARASSSGEEEAVGRVGRFVGARVGQGGRKSPKALLVRRAAPACRPGCGRSRRPGCGSGRG